MAPLQRFFHDANIGTGYLFGNQIRHSGTTINAAAPPFHHQNLSKIRFGKLLQGAKQAKFNPSGATATSGSKTITGTFSDVNS
ncbi:hypothetical protein [Hymenobacter ruber]